jgi:hypothetical protein
MATATVQYFSSTGQLNASLAPAASARVIAAVQCPDEFSTDTRWRVAIIGSSSQQGGEWVRSVLGDDSVPMNHTAASYPTYEAAGLDLLYPFNELSVFWNDDPSTAPEFTVRAWVIYA